MTATCSGCDSTWTALTYCHCAGCHRLFSGRTPFDTHRRRGACSDPIKIRNEAGERALFLVDGVWSGTETLPGAGLRAWRESHQEEST